MTAWAITVLILFGCALTMTVVKVIRMDPLTGGDFISAAIHVALITWGIVALVSQ